MADQEPGWLGRLAFGVGSEAAAHNPDLSDEDRIRLRRRGRWIVTAILATVLVAVVAAWAVARTFLAVITAAFLAMAVVVIVGLPIGIVLDRREAHRRAEHRQ